MNSTSIHTSSGPYQAVQNGADVTANTIHFTQLTESVIRAIYNEIIIADPPQVTFQQQMQIYILTQLHTLLLI